MGYMGLSSVGESDMAADLVHTLGHSLIKQLRKSYKEDECNCYNTSGPVNVGLFLEEIRHTYMFSGLEDYVTNEFLPKFTKYVAKIAKEDIEEVWDNNRENRNFHLNAYRRIIRNLTRKINGNE